MKYNCFVSGHRDITEDEFKEHYIPKIEWYRSRGANFIVGDCEGVDSLVQSYLSYPQYRVELTIYHIGEKPMNNIGGHNIKGGYTSDFDRDFAMTKDSNLDIAWIRKGKERSRTQQNLDRRKWLNKRIKKGLPIDRTEL